MPTAPSAPDFRKNFEILLPAFATSDLPSSKLLPVNRRTLSTVSGNEGPAN
jgi:hypothetical protein